MLLPPSRLQDLHSVARELAQAAQYSWLEVLAPYGLILNDVSISERYWCTPVAAKTFASTGGDGVHYSYLQLPHMKLDKEPIVMTVPASDTPNFVIAEGFDEFFGLGFFVGWFALEQIAYQPDWVTEYFSKPDPDADPKLGIRPETICKKLGVRHVPLSLTRIFELTARYADVITGPSELQ